MPEYPEHEKLRAIHHKSQACGELLEWLMSEKRYHLCQYHTHTDKCFKDGDENRVWSSCGMSSEIPYAVNRNTQDLLAEFFDIDQKKLEAEKVAMIEECRKQVPGG